MNTIPPNDYSYFEVINDLVQKEPAQALDPEIMGSLAAVGIVKGKPFNPDARMKKILTDAAAIGTAAGRTLNWNSRPSEEFQYYPKSAWINMLFVGGYNFETPPPQVSAGRSDHPLSAHRRAHAQRAHERCSFMPPASPPRCACASRTSARNTSARSWTPMANTSTAPRPTSARCPRAFRRASSGRSPSTTTRRARCSTRRSVTPAPAVRAIPRPPPNRTPTAPRRSTSARNNLKASSAATGFRPSEERLDHHPAPLQPARIVLHQDMAAERDRVSEVSAKVYPPTTINQSTKSQNK